MGLRLITDFLGHFADLGITIIMSLTTIANAQKKKKPEDGGQKRKCDVLGGEPSWQTGLERDFPAIVETCVSWKNRLDTLSM